MNEVIKRITEKRRADKFDNYMLIFFVYIFLCIFGVTVALIYNEIWKGNLNVSMFGLITGTITFIIVFVIVRIYINIMNKDILMIGAVMCKECGTQWDALANKSTLYKLECPSCNKKNSEPMVGLIDNIRNRIKGIFVKG